MNKQHWWNEAGQTEVSGEEYAPITLWQHKFCRDCLGVKPWPLHLESSNSLSYGMAHAVRWTLDEMEK